MNFKNPVLKKNMIRITLSSVILILFLSSCNMVASSGGTQPSDVTQLPDDVKKLYIGKGDPKSDKVVLYSNGGPVSKLDTTYFDDLKLTGFYEVYVHQANTYNKKIIVELNKNLTFERAIRENQVSVEILYRVAKHFKDKGKKVYIAGHSFGAMLIPALIAEREPIATKYLIMAGRLNFPDRVWKGFRDGEPYRFNEDGVTLEPQKFEDTMFDSEGNPLDPAERERIINEAYATMRLQAGFGKNRYMELLKNKNLKNVIYAYGEKDQAVGRLTKEEVTFLKSHAVRVYKIPGGHGSMMDSPHASNLKELFLE